MNTKDFYFKYIDIDYDFEDIRRFLSTYPLLKNRFEYIDLDAIKNLVPSIMSWFNKKNIEVTTVICINHAPGYAQQIHVDTMESQGVLAINFPLNYEAKDSITRIYSVIDGNVPEYKLVSKEVSGGTRPLPYSYYTEDKVKLVTEYYSVSPVLINVAKPHSAFNCTRFPRGVLTFRFKEDPWFLLD